MKPKLKPDSKMAYVILDKVTGSYWNDVEADVGVYWTDDPSDAADFATAEAARTCIKKTPQLRKRAKHLLVVATPSSFLNVRVDDEVLWSIVDTESGRFLRSDNLTWLTCRDEATQFGRLAPAQLLIHRLSTEPQFSDMELVIIPDRPSPWEAPKPTSKSKSKSKYSFSDMMAFVTQYNDGLLTISELINGLQCSPNQRTALAQHMALPEQIQKQVKLQSWDSVVADLDERDAFVGMNRQCKYVIQDSVTNDYWDAEECTWVTAAKSGTHYPSASEAGRVLAMLLTTGHHQNLLGVVPLDH